MDYYQRLSGAVNKAMSPQNGAPAPILGGMPELQKFYDIDFRLPLSNAGVKALSSETATQNANAEAATRQKISELEERASNLTDPGKYKRVKKKDGGYMFLDPEGNEISAKAYADVIGKSPFDVVSDSENPIDIQYQQDYSNLQDFLSALFDNDKETVEEYYKQNPALRNASPQEVLDNFKRAYPTVYGYKKAGQPLGGTYIPSAQRIANAFGGAVAGIGE